MKKYAAFGCVGLVLLLVLIVGVGGCSTYNSLVTRSTKVDES